MTHPYGDVAIVGVHNTKQARRLPDVSIHQLLMEALLGACADAGVPPREIDAIIGMQPAELGFDLGLGPFQRTMSSMGIPAVREAAHMIQSGQADTVALVSGGVGLLQHDGATAPWTRPSNELVVSYGLFTAAEFALMARRHMIDFGTTEEQLATVAATIRNNGHVNPEAVYFGRGPFTADDILASPMIADPFHLLDCSMTCEGGTAMLLTRADRAADLAQRPVYIHGSASDAFGPAYAQAPAWDMTGTGSGDDVPAGYVGRRAARISFRQSGMRPDDVDVCEFYDPFSFEIIRQLEAFEFVGPGEGGPFVMEGGIGPGGRWPVTTDGGTMSFSHAGISAQMVQRVVRGVQQLRGTCATMQVEGAEVAMCSNAGSGALFNDVMLLGVERP